MKRWTSSRWRAAPAGAAGSFCGWTGTKGSSRWSARRAARKKILLNGEDYRAHARLRLRKCPVCKSCREYNLRVGFARRENGSVKWVYIGNRCTGCGTLGSWLDWKVSYEPTDEMERNI